MSVYALSANGKGSLKMIQDPRKIRIQPKSNRFLPGPLHTDTLTFAIPEAPLITSKIEGIRAIKYQRFLDQTIVRYTPLSAFSAEACIRIICQRWKNLNSLPSTTQRFD